MRILILFVAALLAAGLAPVVRRLAVRFGAHDEPTSARKVHQHRMPRSGGLAILGGTWIAVLTALALGAPGSERVLAFPRPILGLAAAALVVAIFGLIDDVYDLSAGWNFAAQVAGALIAWQAGFRWETLDLGVRTVELGLFALPFTVLFFVAVMNALNLVDGLDGLAATLALLALAVLWAQALWTGGPVANLLGLALAGGIIGFLIDNVHPARQFMGTCGSQLIGLLLAALSVGTLRGRTGMNPAIPLLAFAVPLLDVALAIVRRLARGQAPWIGDREHLHHRLLDRGLSHPRSVMVLAGLQAIFMLLGLLALWLPEPLSLVPLIPGGLVALAIAWWLRRSRPAESV